jgi:hypothetical protein
MEIVTFESRKQNFSFIKRNSVKEMSGWLSSQFWAGQRWAVMDTINGLSERPACYEDYLDAADECRMRSAKGDIFRVRVLASLLKEWNQVAPGSISEEDIANLRQVVSRYPIRLCVFLANCEKELLNGNYCPMVWEKLTNPLLDIKKYVVLRKHALSSSKYQEFHCTNEFPIAMLTLQEHIGDVMNQPALMLLVGQFRDSSIDRSKGYFLDIKEAIILYRAEWQYSHIPEIIQAHDPCVPIVRSFPVFVRYHVTRKELTFYDGKLKRIRPGDEPDAIDLQWFDFRESVIR